ncbi:MAG: hypothetical protein M3Q69_20215 [Acidobacteriota bacterium]|nr:hypothetical protein [Acidobacteriota bacterium]
MREEHSAENPPLEPTNEPAACAACGSTEIVRTPRALMFAVVTILAIGVGAAVGISEAVFFGVLAFGVYLLISHRWRCGECGESWD